MIIPIKYNNANEEFNNDLTLQMRLENYLNNHFKIGFTIAKLYPTYLLGGCIRDLINANYPKDIDIVVLGKENKDFIEEFIKKFNIDYTINKFGGFKLKYNNLEIDLWVSDDLFSSIQYNVDGLFYDLSNKSLVSLTFNDFLENGVREINTENNINNGRIKKLQKFEKEFRQKN